MGQFKAQSEPQWGLVHTTKKNLHCIWTVSNSRLKLNCIRIQEWHVDCRHCEIKH